MRVRNFIPVACAVVALIATAARGQVPTNKSISGLSLVIRCTNENLKVGDEIPVEFIITNKGRELYEYADRTYDRSGRMDEYHLGAKNERGEAVPDPRADPTIMRIGGGLFQWANLTPGGSFKKVIALNRWALVKEPGKYALTGQYTAGKHGTTLAGKIESAPIIIEIKPRTEKEMNEYVDGLTNRLNDLLSRENGRKPQNNAVQEVVQKLMFTCSPRIVPSLFRSMVEVEGGGGWETEALLFYVPRSEEIWKQIEAETHNRGLGANPEFLLSHYKLTNQVSAAPSGSLTYRDEETGITVKIEDDKRHVVAVDRNGKELWRKAPGQDGTLPPYSERRPGENANLTITALSPPPASSVEGGDKVVPVVFSSKQFGTFNLKTGEFRFGGQY